jgi:hypothetical protein
MKPFKYLCLYFFNFRMATNGRTKILFIFQTKCPKSTFMQGDSSFSTIFNIQWSSGLRFTKLYYVPLLSWKK